MEDHRPPQLVASFVSDARTLILTLNRPGWQNLAAAECPLISAAARLAALAFVSQHPSLQILSPSSQIADKSIALF